MQHMKRVNSQKGFTIIELVVVILLLGILAATALPRFMNIATEAHTGVARGLEGSFRSGLALFRATWTAQGQRGPNSIVAENLRVAPGYTPAVFDTDNMSPTFEEMITPPAFGSRASGYPAGTTSLTLNANTGVDLEAAIAAAETALAAFSAADCLAIFNGMVDLSGLTAGSGGSLDSSSESAADDIETAILAAIDADNVADIYAFRTAGLTDTGIVIDPAVTTEGELLNIHVELPVCLYVYAAEAGNFDRSIVYTPWDGSVDFYETRDLMLAALTDGLGNRYVEP